MQAYFEPGGDDGDDVIYNNNKAIYYNIHIHIKL